MALPDDFDAQMLYEPDAWFVHDILELDHEGRSVVGWVDTTRLGRLAEAQRVGPGHPKHFPGAVCVQLTGTLAMILSAYVLGMPRTEGWVGFGTHVHHAKFPSLGEIGPPVEAACTVLSLRTLRATTFARYAYRYTQEGREIYVSEQSAAWLQHRDVSDR